TGSDSYTVQDLFVPAAHAAAEEPLEPGPLYVFNTTNVFSVGFASVCLGIARGALDAFRELSATKTPRGIRGVLREQPTVQVHLARAEATVRAARAFLHETVAACWRDAERDRELTSENRVLLRLATTHAMEASGRVVDVVWNLA